ncbi:hypothetical protein QJQ45_012846 [Haematococcus lacustris]|nr:hypothetical protein QJQ45_012846 [Haematococcus lacustris]
MAKKRRTVPRPVPEDLDSDIEDRDEALQPDLTEAQRNRKTSGEARAARDRDNTYHGRNCKLAHLTDHLPQELWDAFLDDAVQPRVEAISERGVLASLLLGLLVRGLFTIRVGDPLGLHDQPVYTDIPVSQAAIPDLSCRNLFLQLCRGPPGNGANTQSNAAVAAVLAAHPDLRARLAAIPRHPSDCNMVDHVGKQLETAFSNMLTLLFAGRLKKSVKKQAQKRWPDRILALAYGAASFSGSGSVGCRGVPVSQIRKEAVKQFGAGRVVLVEEIRTSRVSSAYSSPSEALPGQPPESFRWLRPVYSEAKLPSPGPDELNKPQHQKAREVTAQRRAAEAAGPIEIGAQAGVIAAEAQAQAVAGAQLHQLQADLQHRELQLAHNQRMQQLQQQLQDLQRSELQRKEQQLADLVAQQRAALLQWEHQLTERQHQLQQQQVDLSRREQDLTERKHQLQQQQADLDSREQQQAMHKTLVPATDT